MFEFVSVGSKFPLCFNLASPYKGNVEPFFSIISTFLILLLFLVLKKFLEIVTYFFRFLLFSYVFSWNCLIFQGILEFYLSYLFLARTKLLGSYSTFINQLIHWNMYCLSHFLLSFYVICYFCWKIVGIACDWSVLSENWERGVGVEVLGAYF